MIKIRKAEAQDTSIIAGFNQAMALETENKQLNQETIRSGVSRMIMDNDLGFYLVALFNDGSTDEIAGCLAITTEWSDWRNGLFWWVQSVYVPERFRRKGIFSRMYQHVRDLAEKEDDVCGIRLYVEKENESAIRTYLRLGMIETDYRILEEEFVTS